MNKIQNISRIALTILNILIAVLPLFAVILWSFIDTEIIKRFIDQGFLFSPIHTPHGYQYLNLVNWTPLSKLIGFLSETLAIIPTFISLFYLRKVFLKYRKGEIFNTQNAKYYNYVAWLFFFHALLAKPLSEMLLTLAVTLSNPPGQRFISISFGTPNVETVLHGCLWITISWVMIEASKLYDEQKLVV